MASIQEVFLVSDWEEPEQAVEARAQRAVQLQAQGFECQMSVLYRIQDGCPVLLLEAVPTEAIITDKKSLSTSKMPKRTNKLIKR